MKHDIIVIGASAGGIDAIRTLLSGLPQDLPASLFITVHTAAEGPGLLAKIFSGATRLRVKLAADMDAIEAGVAYVAAPNLHLIIKRGYIRNRFLPKENGTRPAIDPMFRSAAHTYSRRVIGVILAGNLDDGTAGLGVIRDEGGLTVVQDPNDALHPDMPLSAIKNIKPEYITRVSEMAPLLIRLIDMEVAGEMPVEEAEKEETLGVTTCPGCGGVLQQYMDDKLSWYQCQVGHRFNPESLMIEQNSVVEEQLWRLLSLLKEKEQVARIMAADARATLHSLADPGYLEIQVEAARKMQERLLALLDEFGPLLFPGLASKDKGRGKIEDKTAKKQEQAWEV